MDQRPCPNCHEDFTIEDMIETKKLFSFPCPSCHESIYEFKASTPLIVVALLFGLGLAMLADTVRYSMPFIPYFDKIPLIVIIVVFLYPIYTFGAGTIARLAMKHGRFYVKK